MNVYMMPQEPGKAVSTADVKEPLEEGYTERVPISELFKAPPKPSNEGILQGADMLWMRKMVRFEAREVIREELAQAVERFFARGLDNLMTAIKAPEHDETEELAAILATLKPEEFEAIIAKVQQKLA